MGEFQGGLLALVGLCSLASGALAEDRIPLSEIDPDTRCAIARPPNCDINTAVKFGLTETGLTPRFPEGVTCPAIDEAFAISYSDKRDREQYHGGIDMPAPFGTPMLAAADGTVVAVYDGEMSYRGKEVILRHSPEQTGLPYWIYSQYSHFDEMPHVQVGDAVKMGQNLGPTGNSGRGKKPGVQSQKRRPAIHFGMFYSTDPHYAEAKMTIVPKGGKWMDPNALYRRSDVIDSDVLRDLPDDQKIVDIPVILQDGTTIPADTKLIWPYACERG